MGLDRNDLDVLVRAVEYYQTRLAEVELRYVELRGRVDAFVDQFIERGEDD